MNSAAGGALNLLGTPSPVWIPIVHDGRAMRNDYFSMNAVIIQNEILSLEVAGVGMPLGNGKASVSDEQARPADP